jgi:hypothetical protein
MRRPRAKAAIILIFLALLLTACSRSPDDKAITGEIQARLYQDTTLKRRDISIIAQQGVVILSGQVQTEEERTRAAKLANEVRGVKQVINQLVVVSPLPAEQPAVPEEPVPARQSPKSQSGPAPRQ